MFAYARIQTNRATLAKFLKEFEAYLAPGEELSAPRPLPKSFQKFYVAYIQVADHGENHQRAKRFKNYTEISREDYLESIEGINYSWSVGHEGG